MALPPFRGVLSALPTPFQGGSVDVSSLSKLVAWQTAEGVSGFVAVGTTGESPTLKTDEHRLVIETVVAAAKGKGPVIGGAGSNDTSHAVALAKACHAAGADGILAVTPYYNKPSQDGLVAHFTAIADATPLPVVLYNVPGRTGCDLLPDTVAKLASHARIVGIKEATGSMARISELRARLGADFLILSGDDFSAFPAFCLGAHGVISVVSNVAPRWTAELWQAHVTGDLAAARAFHEQLFPLIELLFCEPSPVPTKTALAHLGHMTDEARLPLVPMTAAGRARLLAFVDRSLRADAAPARAQGRR